MNIKECSNHLWLFLRLNSSRSVILSTDVGVVWHKNKTLFLQLYTLWGYFLPLFLLIIFCYATDSWFFSQPQGILKFYLKTNLRCSFFQGSIFFLKLKKRSKNFYIFSSQKQRWIWNTNSLNHSQPKNYVHHIGISRTDAQALRCEI